MKDQIAVVTGGAQGIGLAVARLLAEQGARVASWDIDPGNAATGPVVCSGAQLLRHPTGTRRLAKRRFAPAFPIPAFPIIES